MPDPSTISRRSFVSAAASCGAHLTVLSSVASADPLRWFVSRQAGKVTTTEPWARIEQLADGLWAVVSTPLAGDPKTLCNGGIVAGRTRTLVVDSFAQVDGAGWLGEWARTLTGRWPTDVVLTHFHGDHSSGLTGYLKSGERPRFWVTTATRDLVRNRDAQRGDVSADKVAVLNDITPLSTTGPTEIDLGGRTLRVVPRAGHTPSDVTIEVDDPSVVYCGDLLWNNMFPNYVDATPSTLSRDVRAMLRERETVYVPGHGPIADAADTRRYLVVLDDVEAAARTAFDRGVPAAEAAKTYRLPESVGEWVRFSPRYYEVALAAWERELRDG